MSTWFSYPPSPLGMLLVMTLNLLLWVIFKKEYIAKYPLSLLWYNLSILFITLIWMYSLYPSERFIGFDGHFIWDPSTALLSLLTLTLSLLAFIYAYSALYFQSFLMGEYYLLGLFSLLGMLVLTSAGSLLVLYLGLAIMTVPLYAMAGLKSKFSSTIQFEAIIKYVVINVLAAVFLLYGIAFFYGITHSMLFTHAIPPDYLNGSVLLQVGIGLILIALLCKLGVAPFHFWVPDIYQVTSIATALWVATIPKLALLGVMSQFMSISLSVMPLGWQSVLRCIGMLSVILGHSIALKQTDIRRLLAYASIANMGLSVMGFTLSHCATIAIFYGVSYSFTLMIVLGVFAALSRIGIEVQSISDVAHLGYRVPSLAAVLVFALLMMSGLPPFIGFFAKFNLLHGLMTTGHYTIAGLSVVFTAIGIYYYLNIIKVMYFELDADEIVPISAQNHWVLGVLIINIIAVSCLGLWPDIFMNFYEKGVYALAR